MAVKYRIEYDDIDENTTKIDIASASYSGAVITLLGAENPLSIDLPACKDIFDPVQASGGVVRVLAKDSDDLRSLYTADPKEFTISIYKSTVLFFHGYISTGYYSEPFSEYDNYEISIIFNDGLNLLDRYDYLDSGSTYTGEDTVLDVVRRCIDQIGLSTTHIMIGEDMLYTGQSTGSTYTLLDHITVNNKNYYDENDTPMKFREVLEGILTGLGLISFMYNNKYIILDPLMLDASITLKSFLVSTGAYSSSTTVVPTKEEGTDFEWYEEGAMLDFMSGFSKIAMNYSGYAADNMIQASNWSDVSQHSADGSWVNAGIDSDDGDNYYYNSTWGGISGWTLSNGAAWYASRYDNQDEYHCRWTRAIPDEDGDELLRMKYTGDSEYVRGMENQYLKVSFQMHVQTGDAYYNAQGDTDPFYGMWQRFRIKIGSHYYQGGSTTWSTTACETNQVSKNQSAVNDSWFTFSFAIPLWQYAGTAADISGKIEISLYDYASSTNGSWNIIEGDEDLRVFSVKDFEVSIVDSAGNELNQDRLYECDLNTLWQAQSPDINLIHGESSDGVASHRAGFIADDGNFAEGFKYGTMTVYEHLSKVLFKKYASQYENSRMRLSCKITAPLMAYAGIGKLCTIAESTNLPGRKFVLLNGTYNDRDRYISGDWIELLEDNIAII